jgi:hypothetical protein
VLITASEDHQRQADRGDGRHHSLPRTRGPQLPLTSLACVHVRCSRLFASPPPPNSPRRRLPTYEAQFDALLASCRRRLYKLEGRGKIYVTTCISDADVDEYRNGTLTGDDLRAKLQFKVGHTSSLTRRCCQYRKCENGQTHIWLWSYDAPQRYLAGECGLVLHTCLSFRRTSHPPAPIWPRGAHGAPDLPGMRCETPRVLLPGVCWGSEGA